MSEFWKLIASIGGIGAIIVGLAAFLSNIISKKVEQKTKYKYDSELEELKYQLQRLKDREIEMLRFNISTAKDKSSLFYGKQFEIYSKIWNSLFQLKLYGDLLWEEVNSNRLEQFANQLKKTKEELGQYSLFISENDYEELSKILIDFNNFSDGKMKLWEFRNLREVSDWQVESMIQSNGQHRNRYNELLEKIKRDIQHKLNGEEQLLQREYKLQEEELRQREEELLAGQRYFK